MCPQRIPITDYRRNPNLNLVRGERLFQDRLGAPRTVSDELCGAIYDHLWGVSAVESEMSSIRILALGQKMGRVRVLPAIVILVVHMLAEHDEVGPGNGLQTIHVLQEFVRRRAAR